MLDPVLKRLDQLRALERAAAADPGQRLNGRHQPTPSFEQYDAAWRNLPDLIESLPRPEGWIALDAWCERHPHRFGDVDMPARERAPMAWVQGVRSVRAALLEAVLRRASERLARPEDAELWTDARLLEWLSSLAKQERGDVDTLAALLTALPTATFIASSLTSALLRARVGQLSKRAMLFQFRGLEVAQDAAGVRVQVRFVESLGVDDPIRVELVERDRRQPVRGAAVRLSRAAPGLALVASSDAQAEVSPGQVDLVVPRDAWRVEPGTLLAVRVSGAGPTFVAGAADAPARAKGPIAALPRASVKCPRCSERAPVLIDGSCPACSAGGSAGERQALLAPWAEVRCPHCAGAVFSHRFPRRVGARMESDYRCDRCGQGWVIEGGEISADPFQRAVADAPPQDPWMDFLRGLETSLAQGVFAHDTGSKLTSLAASLSTSSLQPPWGDWLLQLCDGLEHHWRNYPVQDEVDREYADQVGGRILTALDAIRSFLEPG